MISRNKYRILVWIVIVLIAVNLSMGISFLYHKHQDDKLTEQVEEAAVEVPAQRRARFFREQLNLNREQLEKFRELNRSFNRSAWKITNELQSLRLEMIQELGNENPDAEKLDSISTNIGLLHTQLKNETISYYMRMREVCDEEQKQKLNEIFMSMLKNNEDVKLPQRGRMRNNNQE